jgi:hypothetical protein
MARPLIIDPATKARVAEVLAYAEKHPYRPGPGIPPPGDDPHFVLPFSHGYRAVFSYTHIKGKVARHLSISVPTPRKYPNVAAAFTIAQLFGFTGWDEHTIDRSPNGWAMAVNEEEHCVTLVQEIN